MFKMTLTACVILTGLACQPVHAIGFGNPLTVPSQWPEKGAFTCKTSDTRTITSTRSAARAPAHGQPGLEDDGKRGR